MAEAHDQTESLFAAAAALPPGERDAYLQRECAGDTALLDRLMALLKAHDRAGHVIDRPVNGDPDQTAGYAPTGEQPGTIIAGRYKLLEEIGQGGMGTVWAAEQTTPVRRKVALKLIKAGMDSRSVLARFEAERQALALMDHPNIAKVLDGGLTESGRPYFVMEYVKGVPITEYCDATRLSVEERLNLFVQVCSALQHAHQKGIIHRDLKPSNILVAPYDDKPVPKVIDFGLAKAMNQSLTEKTLYTAHETVLGTPLYMSPEQAQLNNLDVDTRADIYSLGVLLYELLTGTTPLERKRFKEAAWDEMRRLIREEEPPRPSVRLSSTDTLPALATCRHTEPAKLKKLVRGELDWIVMKALEKDRTRRYETASGFARDIQRHLNDEIVEARPPSAGYRIGKFVRRHTGRVIAASLVLLALLAGIAGTTWGLVREARAKARLAKSLDRETKANVDLSAANAKVQARYDLAVDAVKTFHTGVSEDFLLKEEKFKDLRNRLLKSASDFYGKLGTLLGNETDLASRRALAKSNFELAELTRKVGRSEAALAAHKAVLAAREALAADLEANNGFKADVGRSLTAVAELLDQTGKRDEALAMYLRSESLLAGLAGPDPAVRAALAACRTRMARSLVYAGKSAEALEAFRLARADQEVLAAVPGASADQRYELATTVYLIGARLSSIGRYAEAEAEYRTSLRMFRKLIDEHPKSADYRSSLAGNQLQLGVELWHAGRPGAAETEFRAALSLYQSLADENTAVTQFRWNIANGREWLGGLLLCTAGRPAEAEAECRDGLAIVCRLLDENPGVTRFRSLEAIAHDNLSRLSLQRGDPVAADAESRKALAIMQRLVAEHGATFYRDDIAFYEDSLGDALRALGKFGDARHCYERAIEAVEAAAAEDPADFEKRALLAYSLRRRGLALRDLGDPAGAAADLRRAIELDEGLPPALWHLFETAGCHAALAGLAGRAGSGVSAAEGQQEAAKAMEWLGRAAANGFHNTNQIRIESALDSLRSRDDFRLLMMDLSFPDAPFRSQIGLRR